MASPKERTVVMASQELLLEKSFQGGESQVQAAEQSPGAPAGDNQMVKLLVVSGPVEVVPQLPHKWEERGQTAMQELKVTEVVEIRNDGKEAKKEEHKQEGEQDQRPELEKDTEHACDSQDQNGIQVLPQSGRGIAKCRSKMEELELLQLEMSFVNARGSGALAQIKAKVAQTRRSHLERRKSIIQGIPGFWTKAVSLNVVTGLWQL